ncbi:MAG: YebC/PmpR family DNA-binding transcriptional regulator [Erysipelotrichaceae bacterium]|nr:YebC/PmpR family DNA-binding transcriptional regulator [Erysipelotrichaceae bacterium]MDE6476344.1 YebC/PmpR family DNA-binding transcriptional regulator [Erysipelotrichaceae bacterium]
MGRAFEVRKASMQKTANAKAKVYSRFGKEILVAAKSGEPDPDMNVALKKVIERAKANQVPADVIKRAIEKAKGGSTENYTSATYEGFGSGGGATLIIECLTDNNNRTISDLRACFNKAHAKIGVAGSVSFNYEHVGMIVIAYENEEEMLDALIMQDVDVKDLEVEEGHMSISVHPSDLHKAKCVIEELIPDVVFEMLEPTMVPNEYVELSGDDKMLFERLITLLDDVDDVQNVYHNVSNLNIG